MTLHKPAVLVLRAASDSDTTQDPKTTTDHYAKFVTQNFPLKITPNLIDHSSRT